MRNNKVPGVTIERLPLYYRYVQSLDRYEAGVVSSSELGRRVGIPAAQVRKDLSYFGEFGRRGVGYEVDSLRYHLEKILGLNKTWPMLLVGAGNLGRALVNYRGFLEQGLEIRAVFDNDPGKTGSNIVDGLKVEPLENLEKRITEMGIKIGIIAVPVDSAQEVAVKLVELGINSIWNFAPTLLEVPSHIFLRNEDLSVGLMSLIYYSANYESGKECSHHIEKNSEDK